MPHINRIRVNNVKYNFGTQIYDDFVMRFSCKNTIYDLANGGGKSVLMLLLLQNLIPNSTLDEKQPIEKLFRAGNDNTVIHSLIEWKLDNCYVKNGYKYMTTGFCARKGRETISDDESVKKEMETASVEYFNYVIFYREFNDNDMRNLPLNNGTEKITYLGLKNYLKELERKNYSLEVKIFEKKGEYQNFISKYGLYESEWEIIRGINKTEGHVRTYFESNYKTTRKVVEDLLIEEIIEKSYNNKVNMNEENTNDIAQVLIDIKDKLMELSKKKDEIGNYDKQIELIDNYAKEFVGLKNIYIRKEELEERLKKYYIATKQKLSSNENERMEIDKKIADLKSKLDEEEKNILRARVKEEVCSYNDIEKLVNKTQADISKLSAQKSNYENDISLKEAFNEYADYIKYREKSREIKTLIDNQKKDNSQVSEKLKELAFLKHKEDEKNLKVLKQELDICLTKQKDAKLQLDTYNEKSKQYECDIAINNENIQRLTTECKNIEDKISALRINTDVLLLEEVDKNIAANAKNIQLLLENKESYEQQRATYENTINELGKELSKDTTKKSYVEQELQKKNSHIAEWQNDTKKIDNLKVVYNVSEDVQLLNKIDELHIDLKMQIVSLNSKVQSLEEYINQLNTGDVEKENAPLIKIKEKIVRIFGNKVITGYEYLSQYDINEKKAILKAMPYLPFSLVVSQDFDEIASATKHKLLDDELDFVILINKEELENCKSYDIIDNKNLVFVVKHDGIYYDDELKEDEIKNTAKKIEEITQEVTILTQKSAIIKNDYNFVTDYFNKYRNIDTDKEQVDALKESIILIDENISRKSIELKDNSIKLDDVKVKIKDNENQLNKAKQYSITLNELEDNYKLLNAKYEELNSTKSLSDKFVKNYELLQQEIIEFKRSAVDYDNQIYTLKSKIEDINNIFLEVFESYYDKDYVPNKNVSEYNVNEEDIISQFKGLKAVIDKENMDLSDKIILMNNYNEQMEKIIKNYEYKNIDISNLHNLYQQNKIIITSKEELLKIKDVIRNINKKIEEKENVLDAQSADTNRLLGSIAHGIKAIEEKYGNYEELDGVDNLSRYIDERTRLKSVVSGNIKDFEKQLKVCNDECMKYTIIEKDLLRILSEAGIVVTESMLKETINIEETDYEIVQQSYKAIKKEQTNKIDELQNKKIKLAETIESLNAYELANEIKNSIIMPLTIEETTTLITNLQETTTLIALEKERIAKSIKDMEQIKENFESQCIQTCTLIKGELDKLSKLSKINMEGEIISIINLNIPYVKDEFYKQRMSYYIDETIKNAENLTQMSERVKYIRARLSWKKLFSAIVTDMNSIKLNLYKRERIQSQSRYLRYEDAVGSTGQSQGIYIQFLIAIINYITSINATGKEQGVLTKVIFIDNPFGAAKDVYIWEPIFKLLKTNNVQLIVPARGATPAITGRFDVNYVLGQKLVDKKQQTVVVDYRSQVNHDDMEYERLTYTQSTLVF